MAYMYRLYYERHLPHYQPPGATLFITFRLAGSLPLEVIQRLEVEIRLKEVEINALADSKAREQASYLAHKQFFGKWDAQLDQVNLGPQWLADPSVAKMMCEALHYRAGKEYTLEAYCVMPNHIHLVCAPLSDNAGPFPISKIMHSLKGYTARQANLLLGRQGDFWQHESYDHVIRDAAEFERIVNYVLENPVRAGLETQWVFRRASC
jgi:putative transposase